MKTFQKAPLALAITALMVAPYALADRDHEHDLYTSLDTEFENDISVDLEHNSTTDKEFDIRVRVRSNPGNYSGALVDSKQVVDYNEVMNIDSENTARVGGNAGRDFGGSGGEGGEGGAVGEAVSGNIGINVAAGDNNAQANDAALSASDANRVFGQAEAYSAQSTTANTVTNHGSPNDARMAGSALRGATGNIGVNIAAGVGNVQQNSLAASSNTSSGSARATAAGQQTAYANYTDNSGVITLYRGSEYEEDIYLEGTYNGGTVRGSGGYDGTWNQTNDVYPEIWLGGDQNEGHPSSSAQYAGHMDFDDESPAGDDGKFEGDERGRLWFRESGRMELSGTASGSSLEWRDVRVDHSNTAVLGGDALRGASGNVGVNITAGTNNMQRNSLAIASSTSGAMAGGGGEN